MHIPLLLNALIALLPGSSVTRFAPVPKPFVVQGHLPATQARKAYLSYREGDTYVLDSTDIRQGQFQFSGRVASPQRAQLLLPPPGSSYHHLLQDDLLTIYLEPGTIRVEGAGRPAQAVATGTPLNRENASLAAKKIPILAQLDALSRAWVRLPATERTDSTRKRQFAEQKTQLTQQLAAVSLAYTQQHPSNLYSLYALEDYAGSVPNPTQLAPLLAQLSPNVRASPEGERLRLLLVRLQRVAIGALAPDFNLPGPDGQLVQLAALRGHYVLVDFWASWCAPCRAENPTVAKAYADYKTKNFTVISISLDTERQRAAWLKAIAEDNLAWAQVSDLRGFASPVADQYSITSIPQNFLLDPQGRIVATNLRGEALPRKLAQLLNQAK